MSKHTPGPWRVGMPDMKQRIPILRGTSPTYIADVRTGGTPTEVSAADARLISAAPEMLGTMEIVLAELVKLSRDSDMPKDYPLASPIVYLKQAIARATK